MPMLAPGCPDVEARGSWSAWHRQAHAPRSEEPPVHLICIFQLDDRIGFAHGLILAPASAVSAGKALRRAGWTVRHLTTENLLFSDSRCETGVSYACRFPERLKLRESETK
jgi:hypothetical protein